MLIFIYVCCSASTVPRCNVLLLSPQAGYRVFFFTISFRRSTVALEVTRAIERSLVSTFFLLGTYFVKTLNLSIGGNGGFQATRVKRDGTPQRLGCRENNLFFFSLVLARSICRWHRCLYCGWLVSTVLWLLGIVYSRVLPQTNDE